ncbi:hypothetical protein ABEI05_24305 [Erwinia billingiae]|uniref:hypothetical protein n=1 Tax=Erwiniaceae TaxID=1903409 RepID=UPI0002710DA9|nr:hypothetical protein [Pantoea sp. YR343]KAJ9431835.1 hypothetical protein PMI39_005605 [Pantoea sp. YR343]
MFRQVRTLKLATAGSPHHEGMTDIVAIIKGMLNRIVLRQVKERNVIKTVRHNKLPGEHAESHDPVYTAARPLKAGGCLSLVTSPSWMFPER